MRSIIITALAMCLPAVAYAHEISNFHYHGYELTTFHVCIVAGIIGCVYLFFKGDL